MQKMRDCKIPFELRKTIRFNLQPKILKRPHELTENDNDSLTEQIAKFTNEYEFVIQNLERLVFFTSEDGQKKELRKKVYVKHAWLRNYTKTEFYDGKDCILYNKKGIKRSNQISIADNNVKFLENYFTNWINENNECVQKLQRYLERPEYKQKRFSEFAYWIQEVLKRSNFEAIFELFNGNIQHKSSDKDISAIKKELVAIKPLLKSLTNELLPSQSLGVEIERASFNYYTVNKKPRNYSEEIKNKEQEKNKKLFSFNKQSKKMFILDNKIKFLKEDIRQLNDDYFVEEIFSKEKKVIKDFNHLKISKAYKFLKEYKANEKSRFYELLESGKTSEEIKAECPLFECSDKNFNKIKDLTNRIERTKDEDLRENLKEERGKHFDVVGEEGNMCSFDKYKKFCALFQKIAMQLGRVKANVKSLEKEKIDAERLQSWAVILEKDNQKYILTIPRDSWGNLREAKWFIDSLQNESSTEWKLHSFESLTLRALDKLCFGSNSTFSLAIKGELKIKNSVFFDGEKIKRKDQFSKDGLELIRFYQTVLGLETTRKTLAIENFKGLAEVIEKDYENKEDFEKDLKKACYYKKTVLISEQTKNEIIEKYQGNLYKIISYDLEKDDHEDIAKLDNNKEFNRNNLETHTKYWLYFWTGENTKSNYHVRLNPEFRINFVEERTGELEGKQLGALNKNRKKNNKFLLATTITLWAHEKNIDLAFKTTDEISGFIDFYNKKFNQKIKPFDIYYYGLDRGKRELLTLGLFKFSETEKVQYIMENGVVGEYNKPEFIDIAAYQIKPEKYLEKNDKGRVVYKSASEFVEDSDVVEKISIKSCFDMSCAKLIKDKIIINGDIATYLELKLVSALRKIYEGTTRGKFMSDNICFDAEKGALFLNIKNKGELKNEYLYFYDDRFKNILSLEKIKEELQNYYDALREKKAVEIIEINRINNLRDALCANAVGILSYLQKRYFGMMCFENLNLENKNKRISEFAGFLASRIEWKLLQKFQTLSLVPPIYKQAMTLQSNGKINQLGIVAYINTEGTSSECPHCGTKNSDKSDKWHSHAYKCKNTHCNFDSSDKTKRRRLVGLDNSDSVAAYNIAKRGLQKVVEGMA